MLYKLIAGTLIAMLLVSATGCATSHIRYQSKLSVTSEPDGVEVFVNGERVGTTPIVLELAANQSYAIEYRKPGYETVTRYVHSNVAAESQFLGAIVRQILFCDEAPTETWVHSDPKPVKIILVKQQ